MKFNWFIFIFICIFSNSSVVIAAADDLEFIDDEDAKIFESINQQDMSLLESGDDLQSLREDIDEIADDLRFESKGDVFTQSIKKIRKRNKIIAVEKKRIAIEEKRKSQGRKALLKKKSLSKADEQILSQKEISTGAKSKSDSKWAKTNDKLNSNTTLVKKESDNGEIFDVGDEEKKLLEIAEKIEGRIPKKEWNEIALVAKQSQYIIKKHDNLWRVSRRFFGSGFYYSKVWSLNPQITNPHEIEPGMVLLFDTGTMDTPPNVSIGEFKKNKDEKGNVVKNGKQSFIAKFELTNFGENVTPKWLPDREELVVEGHYFTYASEETYDDLIKMGNVNLVDEYKRYTPPFTEINVREPGDDYDAVGFDRNSKISFDYSEGFYLNTFVTTNIVQDLGVVTNLRSEKSFILNHTYIYVKFDLDVAVKPGDLFSIYGSEGKVSHSVSDRTGYRYTILAQLKAIRKINDKWECLVQDIAGVAQRGDRITIHTAKINQITKTFSRRKIEAAIVDSYKKTISGIHFGDVVYLDRGRADGIEMGNVFEVFSSDDKGTNRRITPDPTYVIGELTVISLTDNFATALVTNSGDVAQLGNIVISKTEQDAMNLLKIRQGFIDGNLSKLESSALEELDVELNLEDVSDDLLAKADKMTLTEDELDELERQEREKSIMKDHERDLKGLERMEGELESVEKQLNESKLDEDALLEGENLENIEGNTKKLSENAFESLNEIEKNIGKKYLDEDLNAKENPYGLTKYDIEEIEELLNSKDNN